MYISGSTNKAFPSPGPRDFDETPQKYFAIYETIRNILWFRENFASFEKVRIVEISKLNEIILNFSLFSYIIISDHSIVSKLCNILLLYVSEARNFAYL